MKIENCGTCEDKVPVIPEAYNDCIFVEVDKFDESKHAKTCDVFYILSDGTGGYYWNGTEWVFLPFSGSTLELHDQVDGTTDKAITPSAVRREIYADVAKTRIRIGDNSTAGAVPSLALGANAKVTSSTAKKAIAIGDGATTGFADSVALGADSKATRANAVAVGKSPTATRAIENVTNPTNPQDAATKAYVDANKGATIELYEKVDVTSDKAITPFGVLRELYGGVSKTKEIVQLGSNAVAGGGKSTAIGAEAKTVKDFSTAVGDYATTEKELGVAIGNSAKSSHAHSVALGSNSTTTRDDTVAVNYGALTRTIEGVKDPSRPQDAATKHYVDNNFAPFHADGYSGLYFNTTKGTICSRSGFIALARQEYATLLSGTCELEFTRVAVADGYSYYKATFVAGVLDTTSIAVWKNNDWVLINTMPQSQDEIKNDEHYELYSARSEIFDYFNGLNTELVAQLYVLDENDKIKSVGINIKGVFKYYKNL